MITAAVNPYARRRPAPSHPRQRLHIRTLFEQLDLGVRHITSDHLRFFRAAGAAEPEPGENVDAVLCKLTTHSAAALAAALTKEVSHAD